MSKNKAVKPDLKERVKIYERFWQGVERHCQRLKTILQNNPEESDALIDRLDEFPDEIVSLIDQLEDELAGRFK